MIDESERGATGAGGQTAAAIGIAVNEAARDASVAAETREYLRRQSRLADLQIADLERENRLRHWQLRFGSLSAVMKAAFEVALAFIFLAIASVIGAAIWMAAHDDSLVIEAFTVPPDMTARGLTGQAVAAQLEEKLAAMQEATDSARPANSYVNKWGDDIKVQIPDTGVSIGESYRLLTAWLGHQTRITGEVYRNPAGIVMATHAGSDGSATITGSEKNFDALVEQTAEAIYARTQPYRYAVYEEFHGRLSDARTILKKLSVEGTTPTERAWAFLGLGTSDGEIHADIDDTRRSLAIVPDQAMAWQNLGNDEFALDHAEAALAIDRKTAELLDGRHAPLTARAGAITLPVERATIAEWLGDFVQAAAENRVAESLPDYSFSVEGAQINLVQDLAADHDVRGAQAVLAQLPPDAPGEGMAAEIAFARHDWAGSIRRGIAAEAAFRRAVANGMNPYGRVLIGESYRRLLTAKRARAYAGTGDFVRARSIIANTPPDCYDCLRMRGQIDAAEKKWEAGAFWLAKGVAAAPSIPFAYTDWGALLLRKGDYDGAIAKFEQAHAKGPHFADPLEMWGEALVQKNRSDLALAKFEEANQYAPNWGRLHLKWGEALYWSGDRANARKQFAQASTLDLSPSEKSELARVSASHG